MHVLAFRHDPFDSLGLIADALAPHSIEYVDLQTNSAEIAVGEADGLIFMGGSMSANDDAPYLRQELRYIAQAISPGKPVLGVCLGAQLVAKALGSRVYANPVQEIGWAPVYWTEAAAGDPILAGLQQPETIFHWHGETFDLPPGAELLAYSDACRIQAYRAGDRIYGLQFHLEVTPEIIADWCAEDALPIDPRHNETRVRELASVVFGRWSDLVKGANTACVR